MSVHFFGIRHHGPGSARSLVAALNDLDPDVVLVELPTEADDVLALAADAAMCPPVALLGYAVDRPDRAAFLPFARFSPEWCAVRLAFDRDRPVRSIDLPLRHTLAVGDERGAPVDAVALLAAAAGEEDPERWWDDVVEHRGGEAAFAEYRGRHGRRAGRRADVAHRGAAGGGDAPGRARRGGRWLCTDAVVCGAWHVPALVEHSDAATAADRRMLTGLPTAKVAGDVGAVDAPPPRLRQRLPGRGGGARRGTPTCIAHPGVAGVTRWFADAARLLRDADIPVSPDHVIAAVRLAGMPASLRRRPQAGLEEVLDAARAVLTDGGGGPLALIEDQLVVGEQLGSVPDSTPMVPLARDLADHQRRLRLKPDATARTVELDLRMTLGRSRSQLLHRSGCTRCPLGSSR